MSVVVDARSVGPPPEWGVEVDESALRRLADSWREVDFDRPRFDYPGLPSVTGRDWLSFCVLAVSVVGCLWPPEGSRTWEVEFEGRWLADAPAVFACFTRAGTWRPERFVDWGEAEAVSFFRGRGELQLLPQRAERLRQVAGALLDRWGGDPTRLLAAAGWYGPEAVELLAATVPGFSDRATTTYGEVRFDKLAHLCVAMMAERSPITGLEEFPVYPDYMLPRALRYFGVLRYGPALAEAVDGRRLIPRHSPWEVAIRWATVYAAEGLRTELNRRGNPVTTPELDYHLWWSAVLGPEAAVMGEHHRTLTLDY